MSRYQILVGLALLITLFVTRGNAGSVRVLESNAKEMKPVFLAMGQSTVLRFSEKPKKIVVGNQNYFNIEFIDNDLAIQPLGAVTSNLFVYCEYDRVYGFILKSQHGSNYDDLINVKWKPPGSIKIEQEKKIVPAQRIDLKKRINLNRKLELVIDSINTNEALGVQIAEVGIKNLTDYELNLQSLTLEASRSGTLLKGQSFAVLEEILPGDAITKARLFFQIQKKESFTITAKFANIKNQIIIDRSSL